MKRSVKRSLALLLTLVMLLGLLPTAALAAGESAAETPVELLEGDAVKLSSEQVTFRLFPVKENTTSTITADGYFRVEYQLTDSSKEPVTPILTLQNWTDESNNKCSRS